MVYQIREIHVTESDKYNGKYMLANEGNTYDEISSGWPGLHWPDLLTLATGRLITRRV